jgi:flagellar brake protein
MSDPHDESPYWLTTKVDIAYTLNALHKSRTIMTGRMEAAGMNFVTVILEVNAEKNYLLLDAPANDKDRERIESGKNLSCEASMDGARIAFKSEQPQLTIVAGQAAIRLALPQRVLKVQRRAYYRASIPFRKPVTCAVPLPGDSTLACQVLDIGLGGIALSAPADSPGLEAGKTYNACRIDLHEAGSMEVSIRIQHASAPRQDGNNTVRRYGCEFMGLRGSQETVIQRFVLQLERERRAAAANN